MKVWRIPAWVADTNAYVVSGEDGVAFVVDAPPDPERIGDEIARLGLSVTGVLLTHGHIDHTGGAGKLSASTGASVYVHPDDDFLTLHPTEQLRNVFGMTPPGSYDLPERFEALSHGDLLEMAGVSIEVRHTPGHTPGHCCFLAAEEETLFTGDQLFAGSVGRTDLPGGSWDSLMSSMRREVMSLPDQIRVLPGHGAETTIGDERRLNPFRAEWGD